MRRPVLVSLILLVVCGGCGPAVDLSTKLEIVNPTTGWYDLGVVNGQNKLVPSITFSLKNNSDQTLVTLQVNALFRRVTEKDEWGSGLLTAAGSSGLAPGAETAPLTIRSQLGYTGSDQTREEMLRNSHFVDANVELFAKYGSVQWKRVGMFPVTRSLLTK
jgi:hypothetical protein